MPAAKKQTVLKFCDVEFDQLNFEQTLARCKAVTAKQKFRYLVTPNVDHLVRLHKEPDVYKPLYTASDICVCDSRILELLARFSGHTLPAVPGSDLSAQMFDTLIKSDEPVNVIGGDGDVITALKARYGLTRLNHHAPPMGLRTNPKAVAKCAAFIAQHPARYTFICVGSPQQEMIARTAQSRGDCKGLGLCVGASLDFLAGKVRRAPGWMQNLRLEWLYRLVNEPGRMWKRYLVEGPKIFLIWAKWHLRQSKTSHK